MGDSLRERDNLEYLYMNMKKFYKGYIPLCKNYIDVYRFTIMSLYIIFLFILTMKL